MNNKQSRIGSLLLISAAVIWGFAFSMQKKMADAGVGPFGVGFSRFMLAGLVMIPVIMVFDKLSGKGERSLFSKKKRPLTKRELLAGVLTGAALTIATALQQVGIDLTSAGKSAFITSFYVVLVPLAYTVLFRKPAGLRLWCAVALAIVGLSLISLKGGLGALEVADLLLILCTLFFCAHILIISYFADTVDGLRVSAIQFLSAGVMNLVIALIFEPGTLINLKDAIFPLLYMGLLSSCCGYTFQILGQQRCNPTVASILMSCESLFGALGGMIILGERLTPQEYIGGIVLFAAVVLSQLPEREKATPPPEE